MFHLIALVCLFTATLFDAFGNATVPQGLNCSACAWLAINVSNSWLCGAEFNITRVWRCTLHSLSNNSDQTLLMHAGEFAGKLQSPVNCQDQVGKQEATTEQTTPQTKQKDDFWMPFLYGAAAGAGLLIFVDMILYVWYCRLKKRNTKTSDDSAVIDTECEMTETFLSVDQETVQPLCEDDFDAVVVPDKNELGLYVASVDLQAETGKVIEREIPADKNKRQDPVYANVDQQTGFPSANSSAINDGGDIEEGRGPEVTTTFNKADVRLKSGEKRYQDLKRPTEPEYPTYENCKEGGRLYMNLLVGNNQSENRSAVRPSSVTYVNAP